MLRCLRHIRRWFVRGCAYRPIDLAFSTPRPKPKAPEHERRTGQDDHRSPDVEPQPQDVVGVVGAQQLDEPATDRVEHPVEREYLAPGMSEPAVDLQPGQGIGRADV